MLLADSCLAKRNRIESFLLQIVPKKFKVCMLESGDAKKRDSYFYSSRFPQMGKLSLMVDPCVSETTQNPAMLQLFSLL